MNAIDIILILILLGGAYRGYKDGFIVSLFSLLAIVVGALAAFKLMGAAMILLTRYYEVSDSILPYLGFGVVFIVIAIAVSLIGKLIKVSIGKPVLGSIDQVAGSMFALAKVTFVLSILFWIGDSLKVKLPQHWTADSWLQPVIADFALTVTRWISVVFSLDIDGV